MLCNQSLVNIELDYFKIYLNKIKSIYGTEWCNMYNQKLFNT